MSSALVPLQKRREVVIGRLTRAFEADELSDEEFEKRLDRAHQAGATEALDAVVGDLAPESGPSAAAAAQPTPAAPTALAVVQREASRRDVVIFGSTERRGAWTPGAHQRALTVFGSLELDFTQALLPPGVTEIEVKVVFGSIEIFVPPHVEVDCEGVAILANFESVERASAERDPQAPRLRVRGFAVFGNVEVITRVPGKKKR